MCTVVVRGDGAEWLWTHAPHCLSVGDTKVVAIVAIYHADEPLWAGGHAVFGPGTSAAAAWVTPLQECL